MIHLFITLNDGFTTYLTAFSSSGGSNPAKDENEHWLNVAYFAKLFKANVIEIRDERSKPSV
jgi:hypothetical protein